MSLLENTVAAVAAAFAREPFDGPWLQVVVREQRDSAPPTTVLEQSGRPLAALVGELLVVSQVAPRCVRMPLIREARRLIVDYELLPDEQLRKLSAR
jgi:hypothetical protein